MTVRDLLNLYTKLGIDVYLTGDSVVRVRAARGTPAPAARVLVDAAIGKLRPRRDEVRAFLEQERAEALERWPSRPAPRCSNGREPTCG